MKKLVIITALISLLFSCKKDDVQPETKKQQVYSDKIVLNDLDVNGNKITLTWSRLFKSGFIEYLVVRHTEPNFANSYSFYSSGSEFYISFNFSHNIIAHISNSNTTTFIDANFKHLSYVEYQVVGVSDADDFSTVIYSNKKVYEPK